jgi:hypothetical protein
MTKIVKKEEARWEHSSQKSTEWGFYVGESRGETGLKNRLGYSGKMSRGFS